MTMLSNQAQKSDLKKTVRYTKQVSPAMKQLIDLYNRFLYNLDKRTEKQLKSYRENLRHQRDDIHIKEQELTAIRRKLLDDDGFIQVKDKDSKWSSIFISMVIGVCILAETVLAFKFFQAMEMHIVPTLILAVGLTSILVVATKCLADHFVNHDLEA